MAKFKEGDIVYHKATEKKGVLSKKVLSEENEWLIAWEGGTKSAHRETELYTKEEFEKKSDTGSIFRAI